MKNIITETKVTCVTPPRIGSAKQRNSNWLKGVIYTNSSAAELMDKWFDANQIYNLNYRCATWSWLKREVHKIEIKNIRKHFNCSFELKLVWSDTAGCSCPCSKGFIVSADNRNNYPHFNAHIHMDVFFSEEQLKDVQALIAYADVRFRKEKEERAQKSKPEVQLDLN